MEKAYDTTSKYGFLWLWPKRSTPYLYFQFFKDKSFKVRLGSIFSEYHLQEMGVPQGSTLSVTLFLEKINSSIQCLKPGVDCSIYVDEFHICYISSNMSFLGAFTTSPVESLYVDAHEPSLGARRAKLSLQYASKINSHMMWCLITNI